MQILVTGGTGYIGSHTCVELLNNNHSVIIADNLSNSKSNVVDKIKKIAGKELYFFQLDVTNKSSLEFIFNNFKIDGIIHFAGYKAISESIERPLDYYYNNILSTILLSQECLKYNVNKFVFSSSATVYGDNTSPLKEDMVLFPTTNPYGETKVVCERILRDTVVVNPSFSVCLLRYFNPVGAHRSGLIGESPNGIPNNLMPIITQVASGKRKSLDIYGSDYDTVDGTGVRDYVHVVDLARGHVAAIEKMNNGVHIYNLGTGKGTSVLQLIQEFVFVNGVNIPYQFVEKRRGDIAECYADVKKAEKELGWRAQFSITDMVKDSWTFELFRKKS